MTEKSKPQDRRADRDFALRRKQGATVATSILAKSKGRGRDLYALQAEFRETLKKTQPAPEKSVGR